MTAPVFEVVLDHHDPSHHARLEQATRDLYAWAKALGSLRLIREERVLRPGVVKLTFFPDSSPRSAVMSSDRLDLSRTAKP